jgi:peroxiredoxin
LVQLAQWQEKFAALGVNVAAMTYDNREILADFHSSRGLGYPLLQDENAKHVLAFGVLDEDYAPGHRAYGIPHPGIIFVGSDGIVKAKYAVPGYRKRPPFDMLYKDVETLSK